MTPSALYPRSSAHTDDGPTRTRSASPESFGASFPRQGDDHVSSPGSVCS